MQTPKLAICLWRDKWAESAAKLRFRTENEERVGPYRKSLNSREQREKGSWLGSKDSNLDCMIHRPEALFNRLALSFSSVKRKCNGLRRREAALYMKPWWAFLGTSYTHRRKTGRAVPYPLPLSSGSAMSLKHFVPGSQRCHRVNLASPLCLHLTWRMTYFCQRRDGNG